MLHHFATNTTNGPCVAYWTGPGVAVVVCECTTDDRAEREADRLNVEQAQRAAQAERQAKPAHYGRRSARYFAPDAFA